MLPIGSIEFRHVTKTYHIMQRATPRVGAWFISKAFEYFRREPFSAIRDLSLSITPGEMVGLLGSNGAGKSTILKLIAGITQPTSGEVIVSGPVTSLLELGVGFHPDLTGMENIFYNGALMGMSRAQILSRLEEIIAFSGLAEFLYEPVKHYSSGMYSRLACSVALHLEPKIILVDEILAVGDAEFQQRGILKILDLHRQGVTVLLVTHETNTARDICDRLIWIDKGTVRLSGDPRAVHAEYMQHMMADAGVGGIFTREVEPSPDGPRLSGARFLADGAESTRIQTGHPAEVLVRIEGAAHNARLAIRWRWTDGRTLVEELSDPFSCGPDGTTHRYAVPRWPLLAAKVTASVALVSADESRTLSRLNDCLRIQVESPGCLIGETMVSPRVRWEVG